MSHERSAPSAWWRMEAAHCVNGIAIAVTSNARPFTAGVGPGLSYMYAAPARNVGYMLVLDGHAVPQRLFWMDGGAAGAVRALGLQRMCGRPSGEPDSYVALVSVDGGTLSLGGTMGPIVGPAYVAARFDSQFTAAVRQNVLARNVVAHARGSVSSADADAL